MTSKKILTIIYLNRSVALAKISFSGKTANVSNYSEFALPEGTIENAIVYDPRTISGIIKEYINAVSFKQIDKSVACIPDNKVKIIYYRYNNDLSEVQNEEELTNLVENEMGTPMPQLSVLAETYNVKNVTQTVIYAIKREILDPYITASRFGASIFPASIALSQALSKNLSEPTVVLYPRGTSLRFFIWADNHVIANAVDGKNVLDIDHNLSNGLKEIVGYGEKLTQNPIKKILFIEGKKISKDDIHNYLDNATGYDIEFYRTKDATLDQYKFLALKGLIKKINDTGLEKPSIKRRVSAVDKKNSNAIYTEPNHFKVALFATIILVLLVGLVLAIGWTYYTNNQRKTTANLANNETTTDIASTTSTDTPEQKIVITSQLPQTSTPAPTATALPTSATATPQTTTVQVLNGTGTAGQAKQIADIITALGFQNVKTGDHPPYTTQKTVIYYLPGYSSMADVIINKLSTKYPQIYKAPIGSQGYDLIVVTGTH